jgi:hypothetical protein
VRVFATEVLQHGSVEDLRQKPTHAARKRKPRAQTARG